MTITQSWVGYLDRSYEQIKSNCLNRLGTMVPELSDHSESNPLVILISIFAGIAEMLNLYIDSMAKEAFIGTARKYGSIVQLSRLVDYNIHACNPATVNLLFYLVDGDGNPYKLTMGIFKIPKGTIINSPISDTSFILDAEVAINTNASSAYGGATQYTPVTGMILGTTTIDLNQSFQLPVNYVDSSLKITINGEQWVEYKSFGNMFADTKGFVVSIDEDSQCYFQFGDGVNGAIPQRGFTIYGNYSICDGVSGNVPPNQLTLINDTISGLPSGVTLKVTNPDYAVGGSDFEGMEDIRNRAPRSIRTLDRAVTYQDYLDLCYMVSGVGAAEGKYCCGKYIDLYIAPNSPGAATIQLIQNVKDYLECRKMITTQISVQSSGISKIWIKGTITGQPLMESATIYLDVANKLDSQFGYSTLKINKKVSIPSIIAQLESIPSVNAFELEKVKILPYARPLNNTSSILGIDFINLPTTSLAYKYTIQWDQGSGKFTIYKGNFLINQYSPEDIYTDAVISFQLHGGDYVNGDSWEFTAFPSYPEIFPSSVIEINDYSAAVVDVGTLINNARTIYSDLTIKTVGSFSSCLSPCN